MISYILDEGIDLKAIAICLSLIKQSLDTFVHDWNRNVKQIQLSRSTLTVVIMFKNMPQSNFRAPGCLTFYDMTDHIAQ